MEVQQTPDTITAGCFLNISELWFYWRLLSCQVFLHSISCSANSLTLLQSQMSYVSHFSRHCAGSELPLPWSLFPSAPCCECGWVHPRPCLIFGAIHFIPVWISHGSSISFPYPSALVCCLLGAFKHESYLFEDSSLIIFTFFLYFVNSHIVFVLWAFRCLCINCYLL